MDIIESQESSITTETREEQMDLPFFPEPQQDPEGFSLPEFETILQAREYMQQHFKGKRFLPLISCTKQKLPNKAPAWKLYSVSVLFYKSYHVAKYLRLTLRDPYILSAKYGLVSSSEIIEPYDETLSNRSRKERAIWGRKVAKQLLSQFDVNREVFIFFTGKKYYRPLVSYLPNSVSFFPQSYGIGQRMSYLTRLLEDYKKIY